jgi:peptidoglycan/LPS O-acetylase OafA/YrhL
MSEQQKITRYFIISVSLAFILVVTFSALIYKNLNYDSPLLATIGYSISALFFMVLCYISVTKESTFLKNNFLRFLGRISFSIYVFHLPVFLIVSFLLNKGGLFDDSSFIGGIALPFISITITLMISFTSYSIFELPILRLKNKFT